MDVLSVAGLSAAIATSAANAAAGEAGRRSWEALLALWNRISPGDPASEAVDPQEDDQVRELTSAVTERHQQDSSAAEAFTKWAEESGLTVQEEPGGVTNILSGNARVQGSVVQAGDIKGSLHF